MPFITTKVISTYVDPSLTPIGGVPVIATLKGPSTTLSGTSVTREEKTYTSSEEGLVGQWTLDLLPNSLFGNGSFYLIRVGTKEDYEVIVPVTGNSNPLEMTSILKVADEIDNKSIFVGKMEITGDLAVWGNVTVSGTFVAGTVDELYDFDSNILPTFNGSLEVVGDLIISGTLRARGTVTAVY